MAVMLDIRELGQAMAAELERRRCLEGVFSYSLERGGAESLYGITGAVNVPAALGLLRNGCRPTGPWKPGAPPTRRPGA